MKKKFFFIIIFLSLIIFLYPQKIISNKNNISFSKVIYDGTEISVDKDDLINILDKYRSIRTLKNNSPYLIDSIYIEIDIVDNNELKHILLGEFNICYKASDILSYKILNSQQLKDELIYLFK